MCEKKLNFINYFCLTAATSLLKWAKGEENPAIRDVVEKLYDIFLIWSNVQKQFAEEVWNNNSVFAKFVTLCPLVQLSDAKRYPSPPPDQIGSNSALR